MSPGCDRRAQGSEHSERAVSALRGHDRRLEAVSAHHDASWTQRNARMTLIRRTAGEACLYFESINIMEVLSEPRRAHTKAQRTARAHRAGILPAGMLSIWRVTMGSDDDEDVQDIMREMPLVLTAKQVGNAAWPDRRSPDS